MIKVLYFSNSGNSKRIAEKIAKKTGSHISVITDNKNWKGLLGFMRGGFYASTGKTTIPEINPPVKWDQFDKLVIVSPVWAGNVVPAVYSLLLQNKEIMKKLVLVVNNSGSETDDTFKKVEAKLGTIPHKYGITKRKNHEDSVISELTNKLKG